MLAVNSFWSKDANLEVINGWRGLRSLTAGLGGTDIASTPFS